MKQPNLKKIALTFLAGYFLYRLFRKKQSIGKTLKDTVTKPVEIIKETASEVAKVVKIKKSSKKKSKSKHKGHRTKRGLAKDQKQKSKEKHEKNYRKNKK